VGRWLCGMRRCAIVAVVLAAVCAQSATAAGFERGDLLASIGTPSVIARFGPDGTPKGVLADSGGAGPLCFDASGTRLIAPGAGLYDAAGALLASGWASVDLPGACVADDAGNVFIGGGASSGDQVTGRGTIRRFDLTGHLLESYDVDATGFAYRRAVTSVDLGPDGCTLYYDLDGSDQIKRFDVCTETQIAPFGSAGPVCDHLRALPDGRVVVTCDTYGTLLDAAGNTVHDFANPVVGSTASRFAALDPDGTSFWMGSYQGLLTRFDIAGGQRLDSWSAGDGLRGLAVYDPPPPVQQHSEPSLEPGGAQGGANASGSGAPMVAASKAAALPTLATVRGGLVAAGRSLLLDTGLRVACPAGGAMCRATVTATVAGTGARAAARSHATPIGTLRAAIAPGTRARLVVRLSRKGAALIRRRGVAQVAVRVSVRAGGGPAVVKRTNVAVQLRRPR
jgi:hypothetical protein